jgi:hypothetical protein
MNLKLCFIKQALTIKCKLTTPWRRVVGVLHTFLTSVPALCSGRFTTGNRAFSHWWAPKPVWRWWVVKRNFPASADEPRSSSPKSGGSEPGVRVPPRGNVQPHQVVLGVKFIRYDTYQKGIKRFVNLLILSCFLGHLSVGFDPWWPSNVTLFCVKMNQLFTSADNHHSVVERAFQHRFSVNVWCGLIGDHVIWPFVFEQCVTADNHVNCLTNGFPLLM